MNLKKCNNGHYFDGDKYLSCPHCGNHLETDDEVTVNMENTGSMSIGKSIQERTETVQEPAARETAAAEAVPAMSLKRAVGAAAAPAEKTELDDDSKTVSYYGGTLGIEPVVGWLVCIDGNVKGKGFELKTGKNFIGRSAAMDIMLDGDNSVSRDRHAIVTYEPKSRKFIAQPGESRELFYLNDNVVLENIEMAQGDVLLVGKTLLKFMPFCGLDFTWEK